MYNGRSPHGERGLKYAAPPPSMRVPVSLPARGAWIEMPGVVGVSVVFPVAPRTGSVD